jgi:S1-C subfamily serine protease
MLTQLSNDFADVVAAAAPSVVQVLGHRRPASGLVYANDSVVTTLRAVGREESLQVRAPDGQVVAAELHGWDPATGIAVLRASGLSAPAIAPSTAPVRVGHIGLALARSWSNAITASAGLVSIIGGPLHTGRKHSIDQIFRTTAPMHDGFAGGAFVDASGGLAGVTTATAIRGLGVIIPAAIAWKAAASALEHGRVKRGYFGIAGQSVTLPEHQRGNTGRQRGVLLLSVTPSGPAAQAGLLVGDVLLAVDQTPIESPDELMDLMMKTGAGHHARLHILRGATPTELSVTIGERPAP